MAPLTPSEQISLIAQKHADSDKDPNDPHTGVGPNGEKIPFSQRVSGLNGQSGENIAQGELTALETVVALIVHDANPQNGHREAIFEVAYTTIGVGTSQTQSASSLSSTQTSYQTDASGQPIAGTEVKTVKKYTRNVTETTTVQNFNGQ